MAVIDKAQLLLDEKTWLPDNNEMTDDQITQINGYVITNQLIADDDQYYSQALCLGLRAIGQANLTKASTTGAGVKRERSGGDEREYFDGDGSVRTWRRFIDSLKDICPLFGYYGLSSSKGIKITSSSTPDINPMPDNSDLYF